MDRYTNIPIKRDDNNKSVTRSTLYPEIPKSIDDIYVITDAGDRLDLLAYRYYNDVRLWWLIAEANGVGKGTLAIEPGTQLRIPANSTNLLIKLQQTNQFPNE